MDSGQNGTAWQSVVANTAIAAGTGITLFVAASDNLAALSSPTWTQVGAMGDGSWTQSMSGVSGRYARYRVILWRDRTTEASPALQDITFNYETLPAQSGFNKQAPANAATGQPVNNLTLQWTTVGDATGYQICYDTSLNGACNASWQGVGNVASYPISGLTSGTWYEWQVRACNSAGCNGGADNGVWWQFRTADPPGAFGKSAPANGANGTADQPDAELDAGERDGEPLPLLCGDDDGVRAEHQRRDGDQRRAERAGAWDDVLLAGAGVRGRGV